MAAQKHTPGPWTIRTEKRTRLVCDAHGNQIAAIRPVKRYGVEGDDAANARLIAAAPEMYEALRIIADSEEFNGDAFVCDFETLQGVARSAIAKAEGR